MRMCSRVFQESRKVCLSLLGTWNGPGWDKATCSIYTILSSIMWGIFGQEHPYYNEPGYGGWEGTQPKMGHIDKVYEYEIDLMVTGNVFLQGHRIRLEIINGDSPLTDAIFTHQYIYYKVGTDTIEHNATHPSRLLLPVVPQ